MANRTFQPTFKQALLSAHREAAGSWGFKPLETDGSASSFDMVYEKFEKLLVYAEKQAIRSFTNSDSNEYNIFPSGAGFVVFMMQHNAIMSTRLKTTVIQWAKEELNNDENSTQVKKRFLAFATAVKKYKPIIRRDLGVNLDDLKDMTSERTEE